LQSKGRITILIGYQKVFYKDLTMSSPYNTYVNIGFHRTYCNIYYSGKAVLTPEKMILFSSGIVEFWLP
jgi:cell division protein YceG involved in septum cleavage